MVTLALDTTTPSGSVGLRRDGSTVDVRPGDGAASPSTRLPRELTLLLEAHGLSLRDVDLFAVASGPGSLTGMRVGIATMQGLAFATGRPLAGVSALDALAAAGLDLVAPTEGRPFIGAWMHAHRGEVFSSLYCPCDSADGPDLPALARVEAASVGRPDETLAQWLRLVQDGPVLVIGDAVPLTRGLLDETFGARGRFEPAPLLAGTVAAIAELRAARGLAGPPHTVRPVYVRRPDAEVARDRRLRDTEGAGRA